MTKHLQNGRDQGPGSIFLKFQTPLRKSGMDEARKVKYGLLIDLGKSHLKSDKIPTKWAWSGLGAEFLNLKTPYLNLQRMKLETSNLVYG